jgi:aspartate/methionine/tyrosine aminotransferase
MAGWRLGFVVGNAEIVARIDLLQDHVRAGVFRPVKEAGIAALRGPQESVAERVARYEARRDRVLEVVGPVRCEGTFYVWFELPEGMTAASLLAGHPWPSPRARASAHAVPAVRASRSRRATRQSTWVSGDWPARSPRPDALTFPSRSGR